MKPLFSIDIHSTDDNVFRPIQADIAVNTDVTLVQLQPRPHILLCFLSVMRPNCGIKHLKPASRMKKCELAKQIITTPNSLEWVYIITVSLKKTYMHYAQ